MIKSVTITLIALLLVSCSSNQNDFKKDIQPQNQLEVEQNDSTETVQHPTDELSQTSLPTVESVLEDIQEVKDFCKQCDCEKAWKGIDGHGSMSELSHCSTLESLAVKLELYEIYEQIQEEYDDSPVFLKSLEKSQKIWTQLREADMEMLTAREEDDIGGSIDRFCWTKHLKELREARIKKLRIWLDKLPQGEVCYPSVKRLE